MEQANASQEVNRSTERIADIAVQTANGALEATKALEDLAELAAEIQRQVGRFRLSTESDIETHAALRDAHAAAGVDFSRVKMAHRSWRLRLRRFLNGQDVDPGQLLSHEECELGQWIYGSGGAAYGHVPEMQELERQHKNMHNLVRRIVELQRAGKTDDAEREYTQVVGLSEIVVALITKVEALALQSHYRAAVAAASSG
jgi:methyl-accepting chemotaxis protein